VVTFLPCFLFIFAGAPYVERLRQRRLVARPDRGERRRRRRVLNLAVWFAIHTAFAT